MSSVSGSGDPSSNCGKEENLWESGLSSQPVVENTRQWQRRHFVIYVLRLIAEAWVRIPTGSYENHKLS